MSHAAEPTYQQHLETTVTEKPLHVQQAEGLRAIANMIEANPELAEHLRYTAINEVNIPVAVAEDPAGAVAAFIRAGLAAGATVDKQYSDDWAGANLRWGPIGLHVYAGREQVCERRQVGTEVRKVREYVEVEKEVPVYEWDCKPLLASTKDGA